MYFICRFWAVRTAKITYTHLIFGWLCAPWSWNLWQADSDQHSSNLLRNGHSWVAVESPGLQSFRFIEFLVELECCRLRPGIRILEGLADGEKVWNMGKMYVGHGNTPPQKAEGALMPWNGCCLPSSFYLNQRWLWHVVTLQLEVISNEFMMWPLRLLESRAETCLQGSSQTPWWCLLVVWLKVSDWYIRGKKQDYPRSGGKEESRARAWGWSIIISQHHSAGMHASAARSILGDTKAQHDFQERQQKERESLRLCTLRWMVCRVNLGCYCLGWLVCLCTFSLYTYY